MKRLDYILRSMLLTVFLTVGGWNMLMAAQSDLPLYVGTDDSSAANVWSAAAADELLAFPYVRLCCEGGGCEIEDSVFYRITRPVVFQVNKWELSDNNAFLKELKEQVFPYVVSKGWRLCKIEVRGAASPEGPWGWNQTLGTNRAAVLKNKILSMLPEFAHPKTSDVVVNHLVEDYPYLVYMLKEAGDPAYELVKQIVADNAGNDVNTKLALQRVTGEHAGLWARLKRDYFPALRAARVLLWMEPLSNEELLRAGAQRNAYLDAQTPAEQSGTITAEANTTAKPNDCEDCDETAVTLSEQCGEALEGYPFVRKCGAGKCYQMSDSLFYSITTPVLFEINKWDIHRNDPFITMFENEIVPKTIEKGWRICRIELRGAASPEGPTRWNEQLAQRRSQALQSKLLGLLPDFALPKDSQLVVVQHTEDYAALVYMMKQANDPQYETVRAIVAEEGITDAQIKQRLQSNPALWRHLLRTYFPDLRAGRLVIWMEPFSEEEMSSSEDARQQFLTGRKIQPLAAPMKKIETLPLAIPEPLRFPYLPADKNFIKHHTGDKQQPEENEVDTLGKQQALAIARQMADSMAQPVADSIAHCRARRQMESQRDSLATDSLMRNYADSLRRQWADTTDTIAADSIARQMMDSIAEQAADSIAREMMDYLKDSISGLMVDSLMRNWKILMPVTPIVPQDSFLYGDTTVRLNRKEVLSIKTNLLLDAAYVHTYGFVPILNAQVEYYPKHGHITPVLSFDGPWWTYERAQHKYFQVRNYQIEGRYYFRRDDARYDGFYAGVYGHGMLYSVSFNADKGYYGEGWGAGLSAGYVLPIIKNYHHLKLEFGLQVGYFQTRYDPYVYGCPVEDVDDGKYYYNYVGRPENFKERLWRWQWFGPTRVGITLTYDLLYRKIQNKGISFKWHETLQEALPVK